MCSVQYQVYICISIVCSTETRLKITLGQPLYILVRNASTLKVWSVTAHAETGSTVGGYWIVSIKCVVCSTETRLKTSLGQPLYILLWNASVVSDSTCREGEYSRWLLDSEPCR